MKKRIAAGRFKAECLRIMEEIHRTGAHIVITKHNVPFVELIPYEDQKKKCTLFEWLENTVHIKGDIISPIDEEWDACT